MSVQWRLRSYVSDLSDETMNKLRLFHVELLAQNQGISLIKPGFEADIDITLFLNTILASQFIISDSKSRVFLDLGSDNGFPGLIIAMLAPDSNVVLAEEDERKCDYLRFMAQKLELSNVSVISGKLESLKPPKDATVVTFEYQNIARCLLLGNKIFSKGTNMYILKGTDWFAELTALPAQICSTWNTEMAMEYELPERKGIRVVIRSNKTA